MGGGREGEGRGRVFALSGWRFFLLLAFTHAFLFSSSKVRGWGPKPGSAVLTLPFIHFITTLACFAGEGRGNVWGRALGAGRRRWAGDGTHAWLTGRSTSTTATSSPSVPGPRPPPPPPPATMVNATLIIKYICAVLLPPLGVFLVSVGERQ